MAGSSIPRAAVLRPAGEQGFVLIAALWLLILGGSIAAVLMLRSLGQATAAADRSAAASRKLALEGAIETVMADRLFHGARSRWWLVPNQDSIAVGTQHVRIDLTSESVRLDVNEAALAAIEAALRDAGVAAAEGAA